MASRLDDFVALSAALTGYTSRELHATGMAGTYLAHFTAIVGEAFAARVWEVGHDVVHRAGHELDTEIGLRLLDDPDLGPVAAQPHRAVVHRPVGPAARRRGDIATAPTRSTSTPCCPPSRTPRD